MSVEFARKCCDLLGWGHTERRVPQADVDQLVDVVTGHDDRLRVATPTARTRTSPIHLNDLMMVALVRHAGPVDVGPCSECGGGGSLWARQSTPLEIGQALAQAEYLIDRGWSAEVLSIDQLVHESPNGPWAGSPPYRQWLMVASRPCSVCGETGRHVVDATEAVLMAAPQTADTVDDWAGSPSSDAWEAESRCGHEGAREALRQLAVEWREHLPVLGDWLVGRGLFDAGLFVRGDAGVWDPPRLGLLVLRQRNPTAVVAEWLEQAVFDRSPASVLGPCPHVPRSLSECPPAGRWLLAWLDGEADPHPPAIRTHIDSAWERETVECPAATSADISRRCVAGQVALGPFGTVEGADGGVALTSERWDTCQRCAGLGRVRPTAVAA